MFKKIAILAMLLGAAVAQDDETCVDTYLYICSLNTCEPASCTKTTLISDKCAASRTHVCSPDDGKITMKSFLNRDCSGEAYSTNIHTIDKCMEENDIFYVFKQDTAITEEEKKADKEYGIYISDEEYEKRFSQRWTPDSVNNVLGYGPADRYVPPLYKPKTILTELDRMFLTLGSLPFAQFFTKAFLTGFASGDVADGYWYNNAESSGSQAYPHGLSKFYDVYSWDGIWKYIGDWFWFQFSVALSPFTLFIPLNVWIMIFEGASWEGVWKVLIPLPIAWFFRVTGENGWPMY